MTITKLSLGLVCLMAGTLMAQEAKVTPLMSKDQTGIPGREGLMITVVYPPGGSDNLTVSLDEKPTANALMLKVLDQIYVVSPLESVTRPN